MDASDKILQYVQLGGTNKTMKWTFQGKKTTITSNAKKVRLLGGFAPQNPQEGVAPAPHPPGAWAAPIIMDPCLILEPPPLPDLVRPC